MTGPGRTLLERVGLHRPELRAWTLYDWANSALYTTVIASVFPIFFARVACQGLEPRVATGRYALFTTVSLLIVAAVAPILGAMADFTGTRKRMLGLFAGLGVTATGLMFFIGHGQWLFAGILFAAANFGAAGSLVFYDSLLPHVARPDEIDRVSTAGYAMGYLGGGILLAVNIAWILNPGAFWLPAGDGLTPAEQTLPTRLAFVSVAVWWMAFTLPLLRRVKEPARLLEGWEKPDSGLVSEAFARLGRTFRELKGYRQAFLMLLAFLLYNDGVLTIIRMAVIYGAEIGIGESSLITAILITQFVGIPFALLFGQLASRIGAKASLYIAITTYVLICVLGYFMTRAFHFYMLAILVGMVQGGTQALSRSLFATLIPKHKSAEFFGFFGVAEKFAGIIGPAAFAALNAWSGSSRLPVLSITILFVAGGIVLAFVDLEEGRRVADGIEG